MQLFISNIFVFLLFSIALFADAVSNLRKDIKKSGNDALEAFWKDACVKGLPIVEEIRDDPAHRQVTFFVRSRKKQIVVSFGKLSQTEKQDGEMKRLSGTNLWYKRCRLPIDTRLTYCFSPQSKNVKRWRRDKGNPTRVTFGSGEMYGNKKKVTMSILELPSAPSQALAKVNADSPRGHVRKISFKSKLLKNVRPVWIYTPAGYSQHNVPCHLLVLFDGEVYHKLIPTPIILDNLIAKKAIPATIAVMIGCIKDSVRNKELPCNSTFKDFLLEELVPWVRKHYKVSNSPKECVIGGFSYGALAAIYAAVNAPDRFGNVLSQSGALWWHPEKKKGVRWLNEHVKAQPKLPLKFYMNVGRLEIFSDCDLVADNRHMKEVLENVGYPIHYAEFSGGHDYIAWQDTLAEGLISLLGQQANDER